jgi:peptide/nickel transport system ATP-binding protein
VSWGVPDISDDPSVVMENVSKSFRVKRHGGTSKVLALTDFNLRVGGGEAVALVGESGSGKTTVLRLIAGLERPDDGNVRVGGAGDTQVIFQDAATSLTPWLSVRRLISQRLSASGVRSAAVDEQIEQTFRLVGLPDGVLHARPRQLSGGQAQRVAIARAVVVPPTVLLADEPTSALDVSLAAMVLNLLGELRRQLNLSMVFVTHDLAVARLVADRIVVMQRGKIVEQGTADQVIAAPQHPYTKELVASVPGAEADRASSQLAMAIASETTESATTDRGD